ncbi:[Fe-Fe] hydrogenase large subunit C-terminal domain-containing protein [Clostridium manihotivorum]|uniref:Iron hydrogenase n=1 Tax=Clostridium manihotivorum TaxID=2320868 RepID=A0A3R5UJ20_9CLOT|nr:[Fe-Fe] hydrogenase large subunit C-terminal domain-containing protein [Clostridium manihotivorum]QAA35028.1 iron hydrogenase [Clostridium manihotivorum]
MKKEYEDLFKKIVKSYYEGDFDKVINEIINDPSFNKDEARNIVSSLCGVDVYKDDNYIYNLKKAITDYKVKERIVEKLGNCSDDCKTDDTGLSRCQKACPFNAIKKDKNFGSTYIDDTLCVDCGLCIDACESGNFIDRIEFLPIMELLKNNEKVVAAVAPAISGQFGDDVTLDQLRSAFIKLGFADMVEVAFAADMLTIKEAVEFDKHVNKEGDFLITSCCCPMWVGMLKKVYDNLVEDVSPSVSPMIAAGRMVKTLNPDAKVVFVGPCIAKKAEAREKDIDSAIDYVLTFEELKGIFDVLDIDPIKLHGVPSIEYASRGGRLYARTGGVSIAVSEAIEELFPEKHSIFKAVQANGVKECKAILEKAQAGEIDANFIEGMGCIGGCVGGPKALVPREYGKEVSNRVAYDSPIKVSTHSDIMNEVLSELGINSLKDFQDEHKVAIFERKF